MLNRISNSTNFCGKIDPRTQKILLDKVKNNSELVSKLNAQFKVLERSSKRQTDIYLANDPKTGLDYFALENYRTSKTAVPITDGCSSDNIVSKFLSIKSEIVKAAEEWLETHELMKLGF